MKKPLPRSFWKPQQFSRPKNLAEDEEDVNSDEEECSDYDWMREEECSDDSLMSEGEPEEDFKTIMDRRHEEWEPVVKDFLEQVKENRFFEFAWPPDHDCLMYRYGFLYPILRKVNFSNESETANKFVDQVRKSWGYDVDCEPPAWVGSTFYDMNVGEDGIDDVWHGELAKIAVELVIDRINSVAEKMMGTTFELVKVNKVVMVRRSFYLMTIIIRDVEANADKTIRAAVSYPCGHRPELEECKLVSSLPT